jgi:hypothetical protein
MLVLNLVPEGVSVKACSFINRKDVSHQRTSGLGSINNLWACSFSNLKVGFSEWANSKRHSHIVVPGGLYWASDEENWICLAVMH